MSILWVEAGDAAKHPTTHRKAAPHTSTDLAHSVKEVTWRDPGLDSDLPFCFDIPILL